MNSLKIRIQKFWLTVKALISCFWKVVISLKSYTALIFDFFRFSDGYSRFSLPWRCSSLQNYTCSLKLKKKLKCLQFQKVSKHFILKNIQPFWAISITIGQDSKYFRDTGLNKHIWYITHRIKSMTHRKLTSNIPNILINFLTLFAYKWNTQLDLLGI